MGRNLEEVRKELAELLESANESLNALEELQTGEHLGCRHLLDGIVRVRETLSDLTELQLRFGEELKELTERWEAGPKGKTIYAVQSQRNDGSLYVTEREYQIPSDITWLSHDVRKRWYELGYDAVQITEGEQVMPGRLSAQAPSSNSTLYEIRSPEAGDAVANAIYHGWGHLSGPRASVLGRREFISALEREKGFNSKQRSRESEEQLFRRGVSFLQERLEDEGANKGNPLPASRVQFETGTFHLSEDNLRWFPGLHPDQAWRILEAEKRLKRQLVGTVYARFRIWSDGEIGIHATPEKYVPFGFREPLALTFQHDTGIYWIRRRVTVEQMRSIAETLPKRLDSELSRLLLFRGKRGGTRGRRRTEHGLSDTRLKEFALKCAALKEKLGAGGAREAAARDLKVPAEYGGKTPKARSTALWRLEKRGQQLLKKEA
jgi:hypothetical protein